MKNIEHVDAPMLLVTGDPGAGKSYLSNTISQISQLTKVGTVAATSYNVIVAVNVDGGTACTMFSLFQTTEKGKCLDQDSVFTLQQTLDKDNLSCLVVDKVSTVDAKIIAILHFRLQQIMDDNLPFGGIPIIFVGGFNQLGPAEKNFPSNGHSEVDNLKTRTLHCI